MGGGAVVCHRGTDVVTHDAPPFAFDGMWDCEVDGGYARTHHRG